MVRKDYDPDNPPPSVVVLSMGTDTTDLVITNGYPRLATQYSARAAITSPSS